VDPIRFEAADGPAYTAIGEGLTRVAVAAERLATDRPEGKYALRHDDGCAICGDPVVAGDPFYLDPDSGEVLCETHGRRRREGDDGGTTEGDDVAGDADVAGDTRG